jgi:hypothetical protein
MSRLNLEPMLTFPDGSHLVVSTQCDKEGHFSCALYNAVVAEDDGAVFRMVSNLLGAMTCLAAQENAYHSAVRLFPRGADSIKKPPYLIWQGPQATVG